MYAKGLALVVILCSISFTKAGFTSWIKNSFEDLGYDALTIVLKNSPWLCPLISQLIGDTKGDVDLQTIYFLHNSTDISKKIPYSEAAETIASIAKANPDEKVTIFLHGFTANTDKASFQSIRDAIYVKGDKNVFFMDCREFISQDYNYWRAVKNARIAAEAVAQILIKVTNLGVNRSSITLVGHSLGGIMAGLMGKTYFKTTGQKLGRVTGLDPAGICYDYLDNSQKLTANDADFVEIWRTDIEGFGYYQQKGIEPIGDADYFPNGGLDQPGAFLNSHSRVMPLYAETILNPKAFLAVKCNNYDEFKKGTCANFTRYIGYNSDTSVRGNFYFQTLSAPLYGLGTEGATYNKKYDGEA